MEPIRSFIAIELPEALKAELSRLQAQLKSGEQRWVKWVDPYSIHLTLKFLGNVAPDRLDDITRVMAAAVPEIAPFTLEVKELGVFPNLRRVQVVWVGLSGELDKLKELQQNLESGLATLGFTPESRPFVPHLTLARLRDQATPAQRQSLGQLIAGTSFKAAPDIKVESISLIKSQLTREGAIYSQISSARLGKPLSTKNA